jgi:hypothetical protein
MVEDPPLAPAIVVAVDAVEALWKRSSSCLVSRLATDQTVCSTSRRLCRKNFMTRAIDDVTLE